MLVFENPSFLSQSPTKVYSDENIKLLCRREGSGKRKRTILNFRIKQTKKISSSIQGPTTILSADSTADPRNNCDAILKIIEQMFQKQEVNTVPFLNLKKYRRYVIS